MKHKWMGISVTPPQSGFSSTVPWLHWNLEIIVFCGFDDLLSSQLQCTPVMFSTTLNQCQRAWYKRGMMMKPKWRFSLDSSELTVSNMLHFGMDWISLFKRCNLFHVIFVLLIIYYYYYYYYYLYNKELKTRQILRWLVWHSIIV